MLITGQSHIGHLRRRNEDALGWDARAAVAVVADGMGGHPCGDVAARLAVEAVLSHVRREQADGGDSWLAAGGDPLVLLDLAHRTLLAHGDRVPACRGMGSTLVLACVDDRHVTVAHVGDSRAYRLHEGLLARLTKDHSQAQLAVDHQWLTDDEARQSPQRHQLTQALGLDLPLTPEIAVERRQAGDLYLLCSDGLTGELSDQRILDILADHGHDLDAACRALVHAALEAGGHDNISVVLLRV